MTILIGTQEQQSTRFRTEQEEFWAGKFGTDYIERNRGMGLVASNLAFFSRALRRTRGIGSCLEFGANIGLNLQALHQLLPRASLSAIEINSNAAHALREWMENSGGGRLSSSRFLTGRQPMPSIWR